MTGNVWYALQRSENGKYYAHAWKLGRHINLASFVKDFPNLVSMNACNTMKEAKEIANAWNEQFKANGTYMFADVPKF